MKRKKEQEKKGSEEMNFIAILTPYNEGYIAQIPALPGCEAVGQTKKKAIANIREKAILYIKELSRDCLELESKKEG